jgi:hypothetical protein
MRAEQIGFLAGLHVFVRERLQFPGSDLRACAALPLLFGRWECHRISPLALLVFLRLPALIYQSNRPRMTTRGADEKF